MIQVKFVHFHNQAAPEFSSRVGVLIWDREIIGIVVSEVVLRLSLSLWWLTTLPVFPGSVFLTWDENPTQERVNFYIVYERVGTDLNWLGAVPSNRAVLVNASPREYCFVITAYNSGGESEFDQVRCVTVTDGETNDLPYGLDMKAPTTWISSLPPISQDSAHLEWSGQDEPGGSDVDFFDIMVSINGRPAVAWFKQIREHEGDFELVPGNSYTFYCLATDLAGNQTTLIDAAKVQTRTTGNTSPVLQPLPPRMVSIGTEYRTLPMATDAESPPQQLSFRLSSSSLPGTHVDATTGLLTWRPSRADLNQTNRITIEVNDDGIPPEGATQQINLTAVDELILEVGSAFCFSSGRCTVPVSVSSSAPRWSLGATLGIPAGIFSELSFEPDGRHTCEHDLTEVSDQHWRLYLDSCSLPPGAASVTMGHFLFEAAAVPSRAVSLTLNGVTAVGPEGQPIAKVQLRPGRIVVLGPEPLLLTTAIPQTGALLSLYGFPGNVYLVERSQGLSFPAVWTPFWQGMMMKNEVRLYVPIDQLDMAFFRARLIPPEPAP